MKNSSIIFFIKRSKLSIFFGALICTIVSSCSSPNPVTIISVSETKGLDRETEYVSAQIPLEFLQKDSEILIASDVQSGMSIPVQILDTIQNQGKSVLGILFPVAVKAYEMRKFQLQSTDKTHAGVPSKIQFSKDGMSIENKTYKVFFSIDEDKRGGQINGIVLKDFNDKLLKRGHISMHWAPNFSKSSSESYFNFEDLSSSSRNDITRGMYQIVKNRSGVTDSVPEIDLKGKYTFYSGLPYFNFESTIEMNDDVELDLLRNDEMTMDSLFTHVVYQKKEGDIEHLKLYDEELEVLEESPIPDDAVFVAFYHNEKKYGFGSIRIEYDNLNVDGNLSPTYKPYTKISKSRGNGRYWNRVLSDTIQSLPKGSRYNEKNAYLIFHADEEMPEKEILYFRERLMNPLVVKVN